MIRWGEPLGYCVIQIEQHSKIDYIVLILYRREFRERFSLFESNAKN